MTLPELLALRTLLNEYHISFNEYLILREAPRQSSLTSLAAALGVTTPAVDGQVRNLEKRGLATRHKSTLDSRIRIVVPHSGVVSSMERRYTALLRREQQADDNQHQPTP